MIVNPTHLDIRYKLNKQLLESSYFVIDRDKLYKVYDCALSENLINATLTVKCGQEASRVGSSSSGSKSGLSLGGSVLKRLHAI